MRLKSKIRPRKPQKTRSIILGTVTVHASTLNALGQIGLITANQLLRVTHNYGIICFIFIDLQPSQETQNPPEAIPWGFDPLPAPSK
jgi:hypothetical protein